MFCPWCGVQNEDGMLYCQACGRHLKTGDRPAQPKRWIGLVVLLGSLALVVLLVLLVVLLVVNRPAPRVAFLDQNGDVVTILPEGTEPLTLTDDADEADYDSLLWSPNHRWLAAARHDWAGGDLDLWLASADGEEIRTVGLERWIVPQFGFTPWSLAWSPDSRSIAVVGPDDDGVWNLVIVDVREGRARTVFEEDQDQIRSLSWLPGGRHLAITLLSARDNSQQLYTLRTDGSDLERVRLEEADDVVAYPLYSARGNRLAYVTYDMGDSTRWLYVSRADGSDPRQVMRADVEVIPLQWSPDGSRLLFYDSAGGEYRFYEVRSETERAIPDAEGFDSCTLSPGGDRLVCWAWWEQEIVLVDLEQGGIETLIEGVAADW